MASKSRRFGHNGMSDDALAIETPIFDDFIYRPVLLGNEQSQFIAEIASQFQASRVERGTVGVDGQIRAPILTITDLYALIKDPQLREEVIAGFQYEIDPLYQAVVQETRSISSKPIVTARNPTELREGNLIAELTHDKLKIEKMAARHAVCSYLGIEPPETECRQPYVQIARLLEMESKGTKLKEAADRALPNPLRLGRITLAKSLIND